MIKIKADDSDARQLLTRLQGKLKDMRPVMRSIAGMMHDAVEENFEREGRPKWKPSKRAATQGGKTLQKSGQLAASISTKSTSTQAMVGTNKKYAAIHQFGGQAGRGSKVTIPERPFLKLTDGDLREIKDKIMEYLKRGKA